MISLVIGGHVPEGVELLPLADGSDLVSNSPLLKRILSLLANRPARRTTAFEFFEHLSDQMWFEGPRTHARYPWISHLAQHASIMCLSRVSPRLAVTQ